MKFLVKLFWLLVGESVKKQFLKTVKKKGVLAYLRTLQVSRHLLIAMFLIFLFLQIMVMAFIGALVTGFLIWDQDFQFKMHVLFWIFTGAFILPAIALAVLLSERLWFKLSGAERMMRDLE